MGDQEPDPNGNTGTGETPGSEPEVPAAPGTEDPPARPAVIPPAAKATDSTAAIDELNKKLATALDLNRKLSKESAARRGVLDGVMNVLNPNAEPGDKYDEGKLTSLLADEKRVNLVLRYANNAGGDGDALVDSQRFKDTIKEIDPAAADAQTLIEAAIKAATEKWPKLALTQAATTTPPTKSSSGAHHGGTGDKKSYSLTEALDLHYGV